MRFAGAPTNSYGHVETFDLHNTSEPHTIGSRMTRHPGHSISEARHRHTGAGYLAL